ncbi:MAG: methionyl-tRNA formyltransferase [Erysipelotrichaceae bacterium]|nr:methionyl-tRNA formyltransferase [Erysipelotrichaceae bacterium]
MGEKIVFMGTPEFAATVLKELLDHGYDIMAVVTQEDKKTGRKQILTPPPVKQVALEHGIPVYQPHRIRKEFEEIVSLKPDLIVTAAYGQIVPKEVLEAPRLGCINTHASLLPKYRGAAPIQRAIMNGEEVTGMSIMYMNEKMDEGDILYQKEMKIEEEDTNSTVFEKMAVLASEMLLEILPKIFAGDVYPMKQDHEQATYAPMLDKKEEFIRFDQDIKKVYDHIRGLLDNPGAYGLLEGKKYKFLKVGYERREGCEPSVFKGLEKNYLRIDAENGFLKVYQIKPEGKNGMDAKSFYNGNGKNLVSKRFEENMVEL